MKRPIELLLFLTLVLSGVSFVGLALQDHVEVSNYGRIVYGISKLRVEGPFLKDASNTTVFLRGVAKPRFPEDPTGCWAMPGEFGDGAGWWNWRSTAVAANLDAMESWGANVVRINTCVEYWKSNTNNHQQHIKDLAQMCLEREMYLIYCPWNIKGGDSQWDSGCLPYPPYHNHPEIIANEQEFVDYWVDVAQELQNYPNLIFEIWNEAGGEVQTTLPARDHYFDVVVDVITSIRQVTDHLCIVQWGFGAGPSFNLQFWLDDLKTKIDANGLTNVAYVTHLYDDMYGGGGSSYDQVKARLQSDGIEWAVSTLRVPLVITETSAGPEYEEAWRENLAVLNEWGISYTAWWWRQVLQYALLKNDQSWVPGPTSIGQILQNALLTQ